MILCFGKNGQLSRELSKSDSVINVGRNEVNLLHSKACEEIIYKYKPVAVINAAAYTAVELAEEEIEKAYAINAYAPGSMARACADLNIPFVHISTDFVFNGSGNSPWKEEDAVDPLNVYGKTKALSENLVLNTGGRNVILRTSWVFSPFGKNFLKTILKASVSKSSLKIVYDQIGGPTPAADLAEAVIHILNVMNEENKAGIYHFAGAPYTNWADFAEIIVSEAGKDMVIEKIKSTDYQSQVIRPINSRLNCEKFVREFQYPLPCWNEGIKNTLNQMKGS